MAEEPVFIYSLVYHLKFQNIGVFAVVLIFGLLAVPLSLTQLDLSYFPGDLGDARFNLYLLEHGYQYLQGMHTWYWNAPFMYPVENVILLSDNLLGTVPIYSVFRCVGFSTLTSFQLWFITLFALNYSAAFLLCRYLVKDWRSAALAAYIFAFSLAIQSQMTHAQVFARFFIPLSILGILKFTETYKTKHFLLAIGSWVGQLYCGIYLGLLSIIPLALCSALLLFRNPRILWLQIAKWRWWAVIVTITAINIFAVYKLMWPYYERSKLLLPTPFTEVFDSLPRPISYFFAKAGSLCWSILDDSGNYLTASWDQQLFPGGMAILMAALFIVITFVRNKPKKWNSIILAIAGIITFSAFLRIGDFSLYGYIYNIPGFASMRALHRIIGILLIFLAIPVAYSAHWILRLFKNKSQYIFYLLLALLVVDNFVPAKNTYRTQKSIAESRVDGLQEKMKNLMPGTIISYEPEFRDLDFAVQIDAMLATQSLHLIAVNGYSATSPGTFTPYVLSPNKESREYWLQTEGVDPNLPVVVK